MGKHMRAGWKMTLWNPFLITILFIYQFAWGFFLYRFVQQIVVPLMHRFPSGDLPAPVRALFLAESRFRLLKTDMADTYLLALGVMLLVRMALSPLIHAGLYACIHQTYTDRKRSFMQGVKQFGGPFALVYAVQTLLAAAPLVWFVGRARAGLLEGEAVERVLLELVPYAAVYLLYGALLKLVAMRLQFGIVAGVGARSAIAGALRGLAPAALLGTCILACAAAAAAAGWAVSLAFAGAAAVLLHQAYPLVKVLFRLWLIGAQHDHWMARTGSLR